MRHLTVPKPIGPGLNLAIGILLTLLVALPIGHAFAREGNRTLKLYFGHTKERGEFTFKRNGRYDKKELARINRFLRDWRRNEPAKMDPQLLDLIWAIYKDVGARDHIHVVSAYRSLATNNQLRKRSRGVAEKSQHTAGRAMDFYIPGVPLAKLRASAMKIQRGGVGFYPTSGSPFVHVDTGSVRYWPRMPRKQLMAMFPNGETVYLPADGKPLAGYQRALARTRSNGTTALAYLETGADGSERTGGGAGGWLKRVFSGGADEAEDNEATATATPAAPAAAEPSAPAAPTPAEPLPTAPAMEPAFDETEILVAEEAVPEVRVPRARPSAASDIMVASVEPARTPEAALAPYEGEALTSLTTAPLPKSRPDSDLLVASLDDESAAATLDVQPEDAIAALAARAEAELPEIPVADAAAVTRLALAPTSQARDAGEQAEVDAFAAIADATSAAAGAPPPRPRPLALAFAGAGLPSAEPELLPEAAAPAAQPSAPDPADGTVVATLSAAEQTPKAPKTTVRPVRQMQLARKGDFAGFAMPQPAAVPDFFTAPATADAVGLPDARLPADQFHAVKPAAQPVSEAEDSFLSRLLAGLTG